MITLRSTSRNQSLDLRTSTSRSTKTNLDADVRLTLTIWYDLPQLTCVSACLARAEAFRTSKAGRKTIQRSWSLSIPHLDLRTSASRSTTTHLDADLRLALTSLDSRAFPHVSHVPRPLCFSLLVTFPRPQKRRERERERGVFDPGFRLDFGIGDQRVWIRWFVLLGIWFYPTGDGAARQFHHSTTEVWVLCLFVAFLF